MTKPLEKKLHRYVLFSVLVFLSLCTLAVNKILSPFLKSIHFKKTLRDPQFFQNCGHLQYELAEIKTKSADVLLKITTILKELTIAQL